MGHEHIRPTRTGGRCITVRTGTAKMEIPGKLKSLAEIESAILGGEEKWTRSQSRSRNSL